MKPVVFVGFATLSAVVNHVVAADTVPVSGLGIFAGDELEEEAPVEEGELENVMQNMDNFLQKEPAAPEIGEVFQEAMKEVKEMEEEMTTAASQAVAQTAKTNGPITHVFTPEELTGEMEANGAEIVMEDEAVMGGSKGDMMGGSKSGLMGEGSSDSMMGGGSSGNMMGGGMMSGTTDEERHEGGEGGNSMMGGGMVNGVGGEEKHEDKEKCFIPCPRIFMPVCGSDGKTYGNECEMRRHSCEQNMAITVAREGDCDDPHARVITPSATPASPSSPAAKSEPPAEEPAVGIGKCFIPCPRIYMPVCADNGKTYTNECLMRTAACETGQDLMVEHQGSCATGPASASATPSPIVDMPTIVSDRCFLPCPRIFAPVCASDGKTYSNDCVMRQQACEQKITLTVKASMSCDEMNTLPSPSFSSKEECETFCPMDYAPVCGSDGKTYSNVCKLAVAACQDKSANIVVTRQGACDAIPLPSVDTEKECPEVCTMEYMPVCGSDRRTYGNKCMFKAAACRDKSLKFAHEGECESASPMPTPTSTPAPTEPTDRECSPICTKEYRPMCASDGITYPNPCMFRYAVCIAEKTGSAHLTLAHEGPCSEPPAANQPPANTPTPGSVMNDIGKVLTDKISTAQDMIKENPMPAMIGAGCAAAIIIAIVSSLVVCCCRRRGRVYKPVQAETYSNFLDHEDGSDGEEDSEEEMCTVETGSVPGAEVMVKKVSGYSPVGTTESV